ncbi:MAG: hypothetical protein K2X35_22165 [Bryobacteraceae bacterium]|nr:hypothetical protein [Bryobacteraceae bacterium]
MKNFPWKTALTILTFGALLAAPEFTPALTGYPSLKLEQLPLLVDFRPRKPVAEPVLEEQNRLKPTLRSVQPLRENFIDPAGSLDPFFNAVLALEQGKADRPVRIVHYGDSPTTADMITADVRALLQAKFGDSGHGFILIDKPWAWYGHRGVQIDASGWQIDPATQGSKDGLFGLGGVSFRGSPGAVSNLILKDRRHQRVEVAYLEQPGGGTMAVEAGGERLGTIATDGPEAKPAFHSFPLPPETRKITVRVIQGAVRVFGASLLKDAPGVIYDSLGLNGAYVRVPARLFNAGHWAEQLRHYRPDLVIVNYGTNESVYPQFVDFAYRKEMKEVVRRIRAGIPGTPILVMSPMDRGERDSSGQIGTVPVMARLVELERKVAEETNCAFFNTFAAMGGSGTMGRWYAAEPRLVGADFIHPMPAGARIVGGLLYEGLLDGYNQYKAKQMQRKLAENPAGVMQPK